MQNEQNQNNAGSGQAMPTPITPMAPLAQKADQDAPTNEQELMAVLQKENQTKQPILSNIHPVEPNLPQPGHIIAPGSAPSVAVAPPLPAAPRPLRSPGPAVQPAQPARPAVLAPPPPAAFPNAPRPTPPPAAQPVLPKLVAVPPRQPTPPQTFSQKAPATKPPVNVSAPVAAKPKRKLPKLSMPKIVLPRLAFPKISLPKINWHLPPVKTSGLLQNRSVLFAPLFVIALVFFLMAAPWTRYHLAGMIIKNNFEVRVIDSDTGLPVSDAVVASGTTRATTNADGYARLPGMSSGYHQLLASKANYGQTSQNELVPLGRPKTVPIFSLQTSGDLTRVKLTNKITKQPLAGAQLQAGSETAITSSSGEALLALAANGSENNAVAKLAGYNDIEFQLSSVSGQISLAAAAMIPAGKVYYVAPSGSLISADLDNSNPQVLLPASGFEDRRTQLLASPGMDYLALFARRTPDPNPQLYLINTATAKVDELAFGSGLKLLGWSGDNLFWKSGDLVKSYNLSAQKADTLGTADAQAKIKMFDSLSPSPDGQKSAWQATANGGAPVVAIGDPAGPITDVIKISGGYRFIDWATNDYVLLSKNSALYVASAHGQGKPVKVAHIF